MVLNSTNVVLVRWYVALLKISNPSGFNSRTPRMLRMPGLPASGKPVLSELHHFDAHVPLFHHRSLIRQYGSSLLPQILFDPAFLVEPIILVFHRLKDRMSGFPSSGYRLHARSLDSNFGKLFQNLEFFDHSILVNQLTYSI